MATKVDIRESDRWFTNTDFDIKFAVKQADETTAQAITGWALSWMLKRRKVDADASALIAKTLAGGGISITDGTNGLCTVDIADDDTVSLRGGAYYHELKRTDAGLETVLCSGSAILLDSAHRS